MAVNHGISHKTSKCCRGWNWTSGPHFLPCYKAVINSARVGVPFFPWHLQVLSFPVPLREQLRRLQTRSLETLSQNRWPPPQTSHQAEAPRSASARRPARAEGGLRAPAEEHACDSQLDPVLTARLGLRAPVPFAPESQSMAPRVKQEPHLLGEVLSVPHAPHVPASH